MERNFEQYLFVYGTLRRNGNREMHPLLLRHAVFYSDAWFSGKIYQVTDYPCAIPSDDPADKVYGELYQLHQPELLLEKLDEYEECSARYPAPREYVREEKRVHTPAGNTIEAWLYLYNRPVSGLRQISCGDFFAIPAESATR